MTKEEKINFLNSLGFIPISENLSRGLVVKCNKNHTFNRSFEVFVNGSITCPECEKEERKEYLIKLGFNPISEDISHNLEVKCSHGHIFKRSFGNFKRGSIICPECEKNKTIKYLNSLGFIPVSKNLADYLEVKCSHGHIFKRTLTTFKSGIVSCLACKNEEKRLFLNSLGFTLLSKNTTDNLQVKCSNNHTFKRAFSSFKSGITCCPECEKETKVSYLNGLGFVPVSENLADYLEVKCEQGHIFSRTFDNIKNGATLCPICFPYVSAPEKEILDFVNQYTEAESDWSILGTHELDIFIPEKNLAIEFNGIYWHSEKAGKTENYHLNKTEKCLYKGVELLHIFENEWRDKKEVWKSIILDKLGKLDKVKASSIKELSKEEEKEFLEINCLEGYSESSLALGFYYKEEITFLMSFKENKDNWELLRAIPRINISVENIDEMFLYFLNNYSTNIIALENRRYSSNMYLKLGFTLKERLKPNCFYFQNPFNLLQNIEDTENKYKYNKIWDCGNNFWTYN